MLGKPTSTRPRGDINTTVEAYVALRASGLSPDSDELLRAREWIFAHGGLSGIRMFTRYWLALLGHWPWEKTPNLPPEIIWLPRWTPFNIYRFSSVGARHLAAVGGAFRQTIYSPVAGRAATQRTLSGRSRKLRLFAAKARQKMVLGKRVSCSRSSFA